LTLDDIHVQEMFEGGTFAVDKCMRKCPSPNLVLACNERYMGKSSNLWRLTLQEANS